MRFHGSEAAIHYVQDGGGPDIVFVSGGGGLASDWHPLPDPVLLPELLRCVVTMGTGARSVGWGWDYQKAEIDWRKEGNRLEGPMAVVHNAAMMFPARVLAFTEDVQAPPQDGREVADLAPAAEYHEFEGMGHCSIYGHAHDVLNPFIRDVVRRYL